MSRPVDVEATLTKAIDGVNMLLSPEHALWNLELREARAAVAELVKAAEFVADAPNMAIILQNHPSMGVVPGPIDRLRAALAKFGGAK